MTRMAARPSSGNVRAITTRQNREVRMFTKVIWATDGSGHADRAMAHAADVARRDGAELHAVTTG
jgi:hypothetical protein